MRRIMNGIMASTLLQRQFLRRQHERRQSMAPRIGRVTTTIVVFPEVLRFCRAAGSAGPLASAATFLEQTRKESRLALGRNDGPDALVSRASNCRPRSEATPGKTLTERRLPQIGHEGFGR